MPRLFSSLAILALMAGSLLVVPSSADASVLDPTFGAGGTIRLQAGSFPALSEAAAVQPGGATIAAAQVGGAPRLSRVTVSGQRDASFPSSIPGMLNVFAVETLPDSRILLGGRASGPGDDAAGLVRLTAAGTIDPSFNGGAVRADDWGFMDGISGLAPMADGRVVAVGGGGTADDVVVARYLANGSRDVSFSGDGLVVLDFSSLDRATDVALGSDGRIYVAVAGNGEARVLRFNADGSRDLSYGGASGALIGDGLPSGLALDPAGRALVSASLDTDGGVVGRLTLAGQLDPSFGDGGLAAIEAPNGPFDVDLEDLAIQANGRIVAVGTNDDAFAVARLLPSGAPDLSFAGGLARTRFGNPAGAKTVGLLQDGRLLVTGRAGGDLALARYRTEFAALAVKVRGPRRARVGQRLRYLLKVRNVGTRAAGVVRVCALYPAKPVGKRCRKLQTIRPGASKRVRLTLRASRKLRQPAFTVNWADQGAPTTKLIRAPRLKRG